MRPDSLSASTTLFTRWALAEVVTSRASGVSTTTMSCTPISEIRRSPWLTTMPDDESASTRAFDAEHDELAAAVLGVAAEASPLEALT